MDGQSHVCTPQGHREAYAINSMILICGDGYVESNDVKVYIRPMERVILDRLLAGGAGGCSVPLLLANLGLPMTTKGKGTLHSHIYNLRARLALLAPYMKVANAPDSTSYRVEPEPRSAAARQA